jgi:ATP-dependent DNA helicase RecG
MDLEALRRLVAAGESESVEFKKTTGQRTEAGKTLCAMLNGQGGHVIFGVNDRGEIVGQRVTTRTHEEVANELRKIDPQVTPAWETVRVGGGLAVIIVFVPGGGGPYTFDDRPYIRSGPTTQRMDKRLYEARLTERMHATSRWELLPVPKGITVADLDAGEIEVTLENAVRIGRMERPRRADIRSILTGLRLIEGGRLLNAALVLYGKSERAENPFPQLAIRLARFRGTSKVPDFADNRQYWGHAFDLLRRAESFLQDHVPIAGKLMRNRFQRVDRAWYPPQATREALANALCHRDYSSHGGTVSLAMFDDRLEISNPNGLHFGLTPQSLTRAHDTQPWNPRIAEVFYRAGLIEKWGMGTINILEWCRENGNPPPRWEVREPGSVVVTFWPAVPETGRTVAGTSHGTSVALEGPESRPESRPESIEDKILRLLSFGPLSKAELADGLGHLDVSGALNRNIKRLLSNGIVAYTIPDKPNSRLQKYRLTGHTRQ